jgi:hypothetical protein
VITREAIAKSYGVTIKVVADAIERARAAENDDRNVKSAG